MRRNDSSVCYMNLLQKMDCHQLADQGLLRLGKRHSGKSNVQPKHGHTSATALMSEFSECEVSDQVWTATHKFGRQAGRLIPDHLLSAPEREHVEGLWQGPRNDLTTRVIRWSEMGSESWLLGLLRLEWSRCRNLTKTLQLTAVSSLHPSTCLASLGG